MLLTLGLAAPGCIIVADDDEGPSRDDAADEGTGDDDDDDDDDETGEDDDDDGDDDGLVCGDNVLVDPGFEGGSPSEAWHEDSLNFDSPLCDESCSDDDEARPHEGDWFAWFGGLEEPETAALSQQFTVEGDAAFLTLQIALNAASGTGEDQLWITIDGNEVFAMTDLDTDLYGEDYQAIEIDLSDFADGSPHELRIEADVVGSGVTNFFVDSVEIVGCTEALEDDDTGGGDSGDESGDESGDTGGEADESGGSDESGDESGGTGGEAPASDESGDAGSTGG